MSNGIEEMLADQTIEKIRNLNQMVISTVNASIDRHLDQNDLQQVRELITYQHGTGGKRLRPLLCTMIGMAWDGDYEKLVEASTTCELVHTGSLILDDIIDWDKKRRGEPTTHDLFGIGSGIMGGVTIAVEAIAAAMPYGEDVLELIISTMRRLTVGNAEELLKVKPMDEDQYFRVIDFKTAALFSASCKLGAMIAGCEPTEIGHAADYGTAVGTLYQLADDIVDVSKSIKLGRPLGDMKNGVITLPLIYTYRMTDREPTRQLIRNFISKETRDDVDPMVIAAEIERVDGIGYAREELQERAERAQYLISNWPESNFLTMLHRMPDFMAESILAEIEAPAER